MKRVRIGGQAVLEGVMMMGPESYALSVRKPNGEIDVSVTPFQTMTAKHKGLDIPIVRGVLNFIESLYVGISTLMKSSVISEEAEEEAAKAEAKADSKAEAKIEAKSDLKSEVKTVAKKTKADKSAVNEKTKDENLTKGDLILTLILSLAIAVGVFVLLPAFVANFLYKVTDRDLLVNLAEGILRMLIFLAYIYAISHMKDIKRTFMYHGAEHKTINCMEAGKELTIENVRGTSRFNKRCGTSFIFVVMIISIIVFMFVNTDLMWLRLLSRLLLIPVIAGVSYEFIRYAGRHENACANALSSPGLWLQRLTTQEPDDDMIEVAIKSVEGVIDWKEYIDCVNNNSFEK